MIDILFIAQNSHQYKYFNKLKKNLNFSIKVIKPTKFCYKNLVDIDLSKKKKEIYLKYGKGIKSKVYFKYIQFITPYFECNYDYFIKKYNPKMVGIWNGIKYPQNIAVKMAKKYKKKIVYFENGFLPNTTQMDFKGVNFYNSVPRNIEFYKNLKLKDIELNKQLEHRKFVGKQILEDVKLPEKYIFIPFQVGYDSQIIYFSKFNNMRELFFLIKDISEKLNIYFVFKEHPSDRVNDYSDLHEIAKKSKYLIFANTIETQTLIEKSEAVVTINSSVGIEALLFHKQVYVLGDAFYKIDGITISCDANTILENIKNNKEIDFNLVDNFLKYLKYYLIPDSWKNPTTKHFKEIKKRIILYLEGELDEKIFI